MRILLGRPKTGQKYGNFEYSQILYFWLLYEPNVLTMMMT